MSMKTKIVLIGILMVCTVTAFSQETYTKVYDDPTDVIKGHVALEFYGVDVGFSNINGAMIFIMGVNGSYTLSDRLSVEANLRTPLLRFQKEGTGFIFDGGANFKLSSKTNDENVRVILGYKEEDNAYDNTRTATTKFVNINGSVTRSVILRAGVYLKNTGVDYTEETGVDYMPTALFHKGIYLGIGKQKEYFFQLQRDVRGKKVMFGAGTIFRPYVDLMVLPVSVELTQDTFGLGAGKTKEMKGLLGARAGFRWYRNPFTKAQNDGHRIPFFGNTVMTLEAGVRPIDGFFINGGISFIMHKF
jgi:hypothetical protein